MVEEEGEGGAGEGERTPWSSVDSSFSAASFRLTRDPPFTDTSAGNMGYICIYIYIYIYNI